MIRRASATEVETLLSALGRSDNAASAMKVLGPHAGKVKQAKEAAPEQRQCEELVVQ